MKKIGKGILGVIGGIVLGTIVIGMFAPEDSGTTQSSEEIQQASAVTNETDTKTDDETNVDIKDEENTEPEASDSETIEEQVLLEQDGIKITAKSLEIDSMWGREVKLLIENQSEKAVTVQVRDVSVNGMMVEPMFSTDVAAGKQANDSITIMDSELEEAGITTIQNMEFSFHVIDAENWDLIFDSEPVYLTTSADGMVEQETDTEGQLVLEQDGISVVIKGTDSESSFWGTDINVYIENNSTKNITVQARSVSVNGFMVEPIFSCEVVAGKKAHDKLTFMESDLEENDIQSIENMEISFHVFDTESWDTIFDSEEIEVSFTE